jgi:hypothetical protein
MAHGRIGLLRVKTNEPQNPFCKYRKGSFMLPAKLRQKMSAI